MSKELAQKELQEILIKTYFSNLEFLKTVDEPLFKRVIQLSEAVSSGAYKERYHLEFLQEKGEFDIFDSAINEYIYKKNPKRAIHKITNDVKLNKSSFFSSLPEGLYKLDLEYKQVNLDYDSYEELEDLLSNNIKEYIDILKDNTLEEKDFKKVEKFIFMGTLLGRHIPLIEKKIKAKNYFVCENNLELFRLSLFVVSYSVLAENSTVQFAIMEDRSDFFKKFEVFLAINQYENYYLKYVSTNYNVSEMIHNIISTMYNKNSVIFDYTRLLHNTFKLSAKHINCHKILNIEKNKEKLSFINSKPVIFVASGPSLALNIEWLFKNKNKFIIVAIGGSYKKLLENNIKPDVISTIDSGYKDLSKYHFSDEDIKKIQDVIILAAINSPERICDKFNQDLLFYFESYFPLKENAKIYEGYSVGEITVAILLHLGVEELYLLGSDLAINPETGDTHISGYHNSNSMSIADFENSNTLISNSTSFKKELIKVNGNFQKKVYTTRIFNASILAYKDIMNNFKKESQHVYNLSNYGAYLEDTTPKEISSLNMKSFEIIDKKILKDKLSKDLLNVSESRLSKEEMKNIDEEILHFSKVKIELNEFFKEETNSYSDFLKIVNYVELSIRNIKRPTFLFYIFEKYCYVVNTYINYHFNDKNSKNDLQKIKKVKKVWLNQVDELFHYYLKYLEDIKNPSI